MNNCIRSLALAGIVVGGSFAYGQTRDLSDTVRGSGLFTYQGRGRSLAEATVHLGSRGDFSIWFRGGSDPSFEGEWTDNGGGVTLNVKSMGGRRDRVSGRGTITMGGRFTVRAIDISGRSGDDPFTLTFSSRDGGGTTGPGWGGSGGSGSGWSDAFSSRVRGRGTVEYDGRDSLREANVTLRGNGNFEILFSGDTRVRVTGEWDRRGGGSSYDLDVDRAFDRGGSRGTGTLTRNRDGSVRTIQIKGFVNSRSFRIVFDAGDDGRPDYGDSFNTTIRGSGTLRVDRDSSRLSTADISIRDDRTFVIKVDGQKDVVFKGRWSRSGRDYALTLTEGFSRRINGSGSLRMRDDRRAERVELSGYADGKRFSVSVVD